VLLARAHSYEYEFCDSYRYSYFGLRYEGANSACSYSHPRGIATLPLLSGSVLLAPKGEAKREAHGLGESVRKGGVSEGLGRRRGGGLPTTMGMR
jgi:hypothetical protein